LVQDEARLPNCKPPPCPNAHFISFLFGVWNEFGISKELLKDVGTLVDTHSLALVSDEVGTGDGIELYRC